MAVGSEDSLTGKLTFEEGMESASCVHVGEPWRSSCRYAGGTEAKRYGMNTL